MPEPRLFAPDPIDLFDPSPYAALPYYSHIAIGLISFAAAGLAFWAIKGSRLHIRAGQIFILAVLVVCISSAALLSVAFVPPLVLAMVTAFYTVSTGWLALQKASRLVVSLEIILAVCEIVALTIFLSFAIVGVQEGRVPAAAIIVLSIVPLGLLAGDVHWFLRRESRQTLRVRRHLARMIWAVIVVVRAPLVEVIAAGMPFPLPLLVFGPVVIGPLVIWFFLRRYPRTA